ncbi:PTS IIA-like nitrogen-regulatory protein PtsN [Thermodesulforhabdus norvegica]|uniref:PTS IIA-like nitrogen-regulatory protein PtsN n=2 Tax=Thermodesulforhabdus norvegica TaxID=39841 RepID=A0A1I4VJE8_9BACT|nr:PTS IIA-like nitrogen-regulatory protein PtsN [Thermodesulforhabdus norvegica]
MDLLPRRAILTDFEPPDKIAALKKLSELLAPHTSSLSQDEIFRILLERENLGSTGVGRGIAIPHGRCKNIRRPVLCFAKSTKGVDFGASDGKPVHLFFAMVAPENNSTANIKVLAKMAEILKNPTARDALFEAHNADEIAEVLSRYDSDF